MEKIHQRLKALREKRGLSVTDVAKKLGVPISTYREWEYGRAIQGEPYIKMAEIFGVSVYELLGGKRPETTELTEILAKLELEISRLKTAVESLL